jgi:hypothetical protein
MASTVEIQALLDTQAVRLEKSMDQKIQSVTQAFKDDIKASNEALKKELIELMDAKIAAATGAASDSHVKEGSQTVLNELMSLKERVNFFESRSNASTAPSEGGRSGGPGKRSKRTISEGDHGVGDPGSSNDHTIKFRAKDHATLVFSGKDAIKKEEAIASIVTEAFKQGIDKEDMEIKGPGLGSSFTVKFKDKASGISTGKDAAELVKKQYKKGENKYDDVIVPRGDGKGVKYSFSWDKSSTQTLRECVLQCIWKQIRDAPKPSDIGGEFVKFKGEGKIVFNYDFVVRVNVGVDGKYRLVWGSVDPLAKIGLAQSAIEALVADRFSASRG